MAWAWALTGAPEYDNLKRRFPDLTAFAGGEVGGFLRLRRQKARLEWVKSGRFLGDDLLNKVGNPPAMPGRQ